MTTQSENEEWPAVDAAFGFVIPSYQLLAARFESADTRVTTFLTVTSTLTLGAPIFAKSVRSDISFSSLIFWFAMLVFLAGTAVGILGRARGSLMLPDPMVLHQKSLDRSEWSFKMNQIFYAGQDFEFNAEQIRMKGAVAKWQAIALLVEVLSRDLVHFLINLEPPSRISRPGRSSLGGVGGGVRLVSSASLLSTAKLRP